VIRMKDSCHQLDSWGVPFCSADNPIRDKVICLAGTLEIITDPLTPFNDDAISFLSALSHSLMNNAAARAYPDVIAFSFWCRNQQIQTLKKTAQMSSTFSHRMGRGLALHITPSNIPVNFAFSFAFSLLAGNSNIVRVPSKPFDQTKLICDTIASLLPDHPTILKRNVLITYPANNEITAYFSSFAKARLIWGGDATIENIQAIKKPIRCIDILFSDRYSLAIINGAVIAQITDKEMEKLAERFFNDTYLMDQNACSSPQIILWQNTNLSVKQRFWRYIANYARTHYKLADQIALNKYIQLCEDIIKDRVSAAYPPHEFDGVLTVTELPALPGSLFNYRGQGGYFYEYSFNDLAEIRPYITDRVQTLVYYGYEPLELQRFVIDNGLHGIDRIVPIGSALDIDIIWDGFDLINELTRIVDIR